MKTNEKDQQNAACCRGDSFSPTSPCEAKGDGKNYNNDHEGSCCCHSDHGKHQGLSDSCCREKHEQSGCCCHSEHEDHMEDAHSCCCCGRDEKSYLSEGSKLIISLIALIAGFCISFFDVKFPFFPYSDPSWIALILCSGWIFKGAIQSIARREISVPILVASAITASLVLFIAQALGYNVGGEHSHSFLFAAGEIAFLMSLGEWLEDRTVSKTRDGLKQISSLMPKVAKVERGGKIEEISAAEIRAGDIVVINPHEMISADGDVIDGESSVNEANMTGESVPVEKRPGSHVLCGTFNENGLLKIKATRPGNATALAKTIELVREAEGKRAPIARAAQQWAKVLVKCALGLSVLVFLFAYFILSTGFAEAVVRATTILVIFCPCAFVLATPTAISAAIGNSAKRGILVKSGEALEALSKVENMFFDKTGTLTEGKVKVSKFEVFNRADEKQILEAAAALEKTSAHPLAHAVIKYALENLNQKIGKVAENVTSETNGKIRAIVDGKQYEILKAQDSSSTASDVFENGEKIARIYFSDTVRPTSKAAVESLKAMGCQCCILSGDNINSVKEVAKAVGIESIHANLLPQDKLTIISKAQDGGKFACMCGDGVNDAPSLATANVSIAIADLKNDIALNSAQIALLNADLTKIPALLNFSRQVMKTIYANMTFSIVISLIGIMLGAAGLISPVWGALLHNVSSVTVVGNSARLLYSKTLDRK